MTRKISKQFSGLCKISQCIIADNLLSVSKYYNQGAKTLFGGCGVLLTSTSNDVLQISALASTSLRVGLSTQSGLVAWQERRVCWGNWEGEFFFLRWVLSTLITPHVRGFLSFSEVSCVLIPMGEIIFFFLLQPCFSSIFLPLSLSSVWPYAIVVNFSSSLHQRCLDGCLPQPSFSHGL